MQEFPIVVREAGGRNRLGVEDEGALDANVRDVVVEGYERVDVEGAADGDVVGYVVADDFGAAVERVEWEE
ncbi:hypothetical protein [Halocalculus aciditolerans]|uniref:Uncharacterized protein n=1 Tax=Halocalculus aciditolerans TaxID=1383812 RepID=A0A830FBA1_9EURY|nr:hypothetical protein [Halocalculus aciditolerans]GGL57439.1 hypothetical protein GCM10009039_14500 [Halocalculus aciditolerans]